MPHSHRVTTLYHLEGAAYCQWPIGNWFDGWTIPLCFHRLYALWGEF